MTIKTFDANRVGGGTFQLEQDATTGEYKIKEVGFVKLPELKLPEIDQAAYKTPTPYIPGTDPDPDTDLPDVGGGGSDGGGGGDQQDFTGMSTYKNIQDQATGGSANLMNQATTFAGQDTGITMEKLPSTNIQFAQEAYNKAKSNYDILSERFKTAGGGTAEDLQNLRIAEDQMKQADNIIQDYKMQYATSFPTQIKAAPVISEDLQKFGPITTTGATGVPDAIVQGQPALPDENIITKSKDIVSNSKPVQLIGAGARIAGKVLKGAATAILGPETNSQVHARKYFNIAGTSGQPQRIAGNPAENVFAGANANAKDLNRVAQKRIDTIEKNLAAGKYRDPDKKRQQLKDFKEQQANYKKDQRQEAIKRKGLDTKNPNEMRQADGGADSSPGGKSIVCTAMYQTTGLQDWAKAMKIWYIYQKRYLTIQHQEGYHKLFKPFVKGMHKSNIIKAIGAHFAKHRTQHLKHVMFNSKPSLLGKIYNKILEPICYWAGRK